MNILNWCCGLKSNKCGRRSALFTYVFTYVLPQKMPNSSISNMQQIPSFLSGNSIGVLKRWEENTLWASLQPCFRHSDLWLRHYPCSSPIKSSAKTLSGEFGNHYSLAEKKAGKRPGTATHTQLPWWNPGNVFTHIHANNHANHGFQSPCHFCDVVLRRQLRAQTYVLLLFCHICVRNVRARTIMCMRYHHEWNSFSIYCGYIVQAYSRPPSYNEPMVTTN